MCRIHTMSEGQTEEKKTVEEPVSAAEPVKEPTKEPVSAEPAKEPASAAEPAKEPASVEPAKEPAPAEPAKEPETEKPKEPETEQPKEPAAAAPPAADSVSDSSVGKRIAKKFGRRQYFGDVTEKWTDGEKDNAPRWHVKYDDGDEEDLDAEELDEALKYYNKVQKRDFKTFPKKPRVKRKSDPPPPRTNKYPKRGVSKKE